MMQAALAPAAITLYLCFSLDLVKAAGAALMVGAVLSTTEPHAQLSSLTLQEVTCLPASDLPAADILAFAQGLQNTTVELSSAQLSCLARLLAAKNLTADFKGYPPDLLLFFNSAEVHGETCKEFYTRASHGDLDLLPRGSARRTQLLQRALACLGVRSSQLDPEQLSSLGALVCDMEPETIKASDPGVLENLKLCSALTEAQQDALNAVLLGGGTVYGDPSSWDFQTLQHLGPLVLALNRTTLSLVAKEAREAFGRSIRATYSRQGHSQREKSLLLLRALVVPSASARPRRKRNTQGCTSTPITPSTISDPDFIIDQSDSEEFDLCLSNEVVEGYLPLLMQQPLPTEFKLVVKNRLKQMYPNGIPERQLRVLGELSRLYTAKEISQWMVTSSDTLLALLNKSDGKWNDTQMQQLISRYLELGGTWSKALFQRMAEGNLCQLREDQIEQIPPEALRTAGQPNISSCSQAKKDQLYRKAQQAFADQMSTTRSYYCRIRPYLGGAPAEDLKELAEAGTTIDMDIDTFLALNPDELEKLSVTDVKNLLGENLSDLKEAENETSVMRWVKRQPQKELDLLNIGLQGGILEPTPMGTTTSPRPTATASTTPKSPVPTAPTSTATSSRPTAVWSTAPTKVPTTTHHSHTTVPTAANSTSTPPPATTFTTTTTTSTPPPATTFTITTSTPPPTTTSSSTPPPITTTTSSTPPPITTTSSTPPPTTTTTTSTPPPITTTPPCSSYQSTTSHKATSPPGTINPNTTSPSSVPSSAPTHEPNTTTTVPNPVSTTHNTSTPLASVSPPAPEGTTHPAPATQNTTTPSTHSVPSTFVPNSTTAPAATTTTEMNPPSKPTPVPSSTLSTLVSSTAKTTTVDCKTGTPPTSLHPSSSTTTTKEVPPDVPETPRPTPNGYINLKPEPGSGSILSCCLLAILTTAVGSLLLPVLL